jgi:hypothetical protein
MPKPANSDYSKHRFLKFVGVINFLLLVFYYFVLCGFLWDLVFKPAKLDTGGFDEPFPSLMLLSGVLFVLLLIPTIFYKRFNHNAVPNRWKQFVAFMYKANLALFITVVMFFALGHTISKRIDEAVKAENQYMNSMYPSYYK